MSGINGNSLNTFSPNSFRSLNEARFIHKMNFISHSKNISFNEEEISQNTDNQLDKFSKLINQWNFLKTSSKFFTIYESSQLSKVKE